MPTDQLIAGYRQKNDSAAQEEIERIKLRAKRQKTALEHLLYDIPVKNKSTNQELNAKTSDRLKESTVSEWLKALEKRLRNQGQALFYEQMQLNIATEGEISMTASKEKYTVVQGGNL